MENESKFKTTQLTSLQSERCNAVYHIYGEDAEKFIMKLKARGENSWKRFYEKAVEVNKAHGVTGEYYMRLTTEFSQYQLLTVSKIQQIVCEVRSDMELAPYFKQIKASALADFFKLFLYEEKYEETDEPEKGPLEGYIPLIAIKAE